MKLAIINPIERLVSPTTAGGGEVLTSNLSLELAKRGHFIDLYAAKGSLENLPEIRLREIIDRPTDDRLSDDFFKNRNDLDRLLTKFTATFTTKTLFTIKESESEYDLVIDSSSNFHVSYNWPFFKLPLVVLGHLPVTFPYLHIYDYLDLPQNIYFIFPSKFQYDHAIKIPEDRKFFIPHGINIENIQELPADGKNKIVWLGRVSRKNNKGLKEAVIVSQKINKQMDVYGYIEDQEYYNEVNSLITNNSVNFVQGKTDKTVIFQDARLFLSSPQWEEPFGLVLLEAMASGTPVAALARGAAPEIIKDGITGYLVNPSDDDIRGDWIIKKTGIEGLCEAVNRIYEMPEEEYKKLRSNARKHVEDDFTIERMVDQYEIVLPQITGK